MKKVLSTLILGLLALTSFAKDKLIVAPAPTGIELKHDFEVKARIHGGERNSHTSSRPTRMTVLLKRSLQEPSGFYQNKQ